MISPNNTTRHFQSCVGVKEVKPKRICHNIREWDWAAIQSFYDDKHSAREVSVQFGVNFATIAKAGKLGLFHPRDRSETMKLRNTTTKGRVRPREERIRIGKGMNLAVKEGRQKTPKPYGRNTIDYKGIQLQSKWELKVAEFLDLKSIAWERPTMGHEYQFEGQVRLYFPDFYLPQHSLYIEVKGWVQPKDLCKWRDFKYKLLIVDQKTINRLDSIEF